MRRPVPSARAAERVVAAALIVATVLGAAVAARASWVASRGPRDVVADQVAYLDSAVGNGAAARMQSLFPEGYVFTHALTGLAAARSPAATGPDRPGAIGVVRRALAAMDGPEGRAPFAADLGPPHGAFWAGWSLLLSVELVRLDPAEANRRDVRRRATGIVAALDGSVDGFLPSYPGQVWPVDTVVAVAALARADRLVGVPGAARAVHRWQEQADALRARSGGLLPHRLDPGGAVAEGPRGSSQALIAAFLPDIEPHRAAADYRSFVERFVTRRGGLVGVREYPLGTDGAGDVDSGPLIAGVSLSASAVALGAARRHRDAPLARALESEAELLGVPTTLGTGRRYALGALPVGDAFLAWARSLPPSPVPAGRSPVPGPLWAVWIVLPLLPAACLAALLGVWRRRRITADRQARTTRCP